MPAQLGIKVEGLRELRRALAAADELLPAELREELRAIGKIVEVGAKVKVPTGAGPQSPASTSHAPGAARDSIRSAPAGASVAVKAGGAAAVHYGWLDFGGNIYHRGSHHSHENSHVIHRDVVREGRYLYPAAEEAKAVVATETELMLDRVFARAGWA